MHDKPTWVAPAELRSGDRLFSNIGRPQPIQRIEGGQIHLWDGAAIPLKAGGRYWAALAPRAPDPSPPTPNGGGPNPAEFNDALRAICQDTCAAFGEPACWRLPDLVDPCDQVTPCEACLAFVASPPPEGLCQDCLALAPYDHATNGAAGCPHCGGDLCACPSCLEDR